MQLSSDGKTMIYSSQSGTVPPKFTVCDQSVARPVPLTHLNDSFLSQYQLTPLEEFWVDGAGKNASPKLRRQAAKIRCEPEVSVLSADPRRPARRVGRELELSLEPAGIRCRWIRRRDAKSRGSTGYGQKFTEDINDDWGGKPYDDIMAVDRLCRRNCLMSTRIAWRRPAAPTAAT